MQKFHKHPVKTNERGKITDKRQNSPAKAPEIVNDSAFKTQEKPSSGQVNYLTVEAYQDGQRIDNFLLNKLKGLPRSHLYKMLRDGQIRLNKKRCKAHERLQTGDVVRVAPVRLTQKQAPVISDNFAKGLLGRVVYEDDGLIVLNKPHGMAVHGGSGESFGVIEALRIAMNKPYLELIHRIDKDTSGLLLISKKRSTLKYLQEAFRQKTIQKEYLCLALGEVKNLSLIDKPLLRYTLENGERRVKVAKEGKPSQTKIAVLTSFMLDGQRVSLIKASPLTGRTHQIRVHLASVGHALLGDDKYQKTALPSVKRLCLHAWQINFDKHHFSASVGDDLMHLLTKANVSDDVLALIQAG